ncbi:MAG TPA: isoaspartyl peptidase/L-asparaginase, partial [Thermoanaerobaculia bacterium]|nr:isoaspartyl peptidase/L-asparaginase [Thermoanaerobaculia bacterium]
MKKTVTRRAFVAGGAAAVAVAAAPGKLFAQGPTVIRRSPAKPVVVSSANGNRFKNGGDMTCVEKAWSMIAQGSDVLDSVIAGVNIVELDPLDDSVGYGGLPNAEGVVQLDSSCMHGPRKRAGAVASLEGVR